MPKFLVLLLNKFLTKSFIICYYLCQNGTSQVILKGIPLAQIVFSPTREWGVLGKI